MSKDETVWTLEPHTGAKHEILVTYLEAWFGIWGTMNSPRSSAQTAYGTS